MGSIEAERNLERLLEAAATDPAQRPEFSKALLESDVCVLGTVEGDVVDGVAQTGTSMRIVAISDADGPLTPFFTSERTLQECLAANPGTDPRFLRLNCRALFAMTQGSRLVLNPYSSHGKMFLPNEIADLVAGREPGMTTEVLEAETQVLVGAPAHTPPQLPAVLSRYFSQRPSVESVYLGWIARGNGETGFLLVVVAPDPEPVMSGFGSLGIGELTEGVPLDVMFAAPGTDHPLIGVVPPLFTR